MTSRGEPRILVVDDDPDICDNLSDILSDLGYQVDTAHDGPAALELVSRQPYDVALLDLKMPGMDGVTLYREIKKQRAGIVSLMVTAFAGPATAEEALSAGAWKVLAKPVDFSKLLHLVEEALDQPLVLVVDDDRDLCENLWDLLRDRGFRVCLAHDLRHAGEKLQESSFEVVLIDMRIPDGDGSSVFRLVRTTNPESRTMLITGYRSDTDQLVAQLVAEGADAVQYKPFDIPDLIETLGNWPGSRERMPEERDDEHMVGSPPVDILVIEDDPDARANLRDILELDDHRVTTVGSAAEALEQADLGRFSAIILDRRLPDATAEQLMPKLKAADPDAAVIVVTGYSDLQGAIAALRQGATDYILKPLDPDVLRTSLGRIIERKRLALAKERSEAAFRHLVEAAECMIVILRPDHSIVYYSPFAEQLTGYSAEEVKGRDYLTLLLPDSDRDAVADEFTRVIAGRPNRGLENAVICRDGSRRWIVWNARYLPDYDDGPAILSVGHDITFVKQAQERALQSERLAAIGEMVTGLAHESRNALQRCQACLEMLALKVRDRPEALDLIGRLQKAQDHLHHLYEDVRSYAAPIKLEKVTCDLGTVWRESWAHLEQARKDKQACFHEMLDGVDLRCAGDPFRLDQVFRNLLDNALAAGSPPVAIEVRAAAAELDGQPALRIAVHDNGPGIAPEQRIENLRPVLHHQGQGNRPGIGHRQAHRRGPRRPDHDRRRPGAGGRLHHHFTERDTMTRSLKIAIADDELDMRDYFQQILPLLGHHVIAVARDGRELVEICAATRPDLVITDIKMPDMDGIEAATRIYKNAPVPVILVSAYHDPEFITPRRGGPHPGVSGQADQTGRPRAGDRHRHAPVRAVSGTPQGNLRPEAGARGPQGDREGQGDPDEEGRARRARRVPPAAEAGQRQEPQADRNRPDDPDRRGGPRAAQPDLIPHGTAATRRLGRRGEIEPENEVNFRWICGN